MCDIPCAVSAGILHVEVKLDYASDVFLVDESNFKKYQRGDRFQYFGGHYKKSPVKISVKGIGRWYLIVKGSPRYSYRFY